MAGGTPLTARDLYRGILLLGVVGVVGLFFGELLRFLVAFFVTALLSLALAAGARFLTRLRLPRTAGVLATLVLLVGAFVAVGYALVPPLFGQLSRFLEDLPRLLAMVQEQVGPRSPGSDPQATRSLISRLEREISGLLTTLNYDPLALARDAWDLSKKILGAASVVVVLVVAAVYAAIDPGPLTGGFLRLLPAHRREKARAVLADLRRTLTRWMWGTALDMAVVGLLTGIALWLVGFEFPLLFGVLAGLFTIVPFFGPIAATILVALVALAEGWVHALVCLGALIFVQQVEGNLLLPLIMRRAIQLHPAVIALGILFVGFTVGPLAVLVAVPILATARVLIQDLWVERADRAADGREGDGEAPQGTGARPRKSGAA